MEEPSKPMAIVPDNGMSTVRDKILHVLRIYPRLSPSMLQIGLGTSLPPVIWREVLRRLIEENVVHQQEIQVSGADGRVRTYQVLSLVNGQLQPTVN